MRTLALGIFLFSLSASYLLGTNNSTALTVGLFGIATALVAVLTFIQKLYLDSATKNSFAAASQPALAMSLGVVLLGLSLGFMSGHALGLVARLTNPQWFATTAATPVPWVSKVKPSVNFDKAIGWIALSDRLQKIGWTKDEIQSFFDNYASTTSDDKLLSAFAAKWVPSATTEAAEIKK